jgi:uncharacterized protein (TIGR03437 family)
MFFDKSRAKFALIVATFAASAGLPAQTVSSVRIFTNPPGLYFQVDGQIYSQSVTLLWPQGSKHAIVVSNVQTTGTIPTQYVLGSVISNLGPITDLSSITADPNVKFIELPFQINYAVDLNYFVCTTGANCNSICPPQSGCPGPGYVILNGQSFAQNGQIFVASGSQLTAEAHPNPGWVFGGWVTSPSFGNSSEAFQNTWTVTAPMMVHPVFSPAVGVTVTVTTSPAGLRTLVDRTPDSAPVSLQWGMGSVHQIAGISPQYDLSGNLWVFQSWSDGGAYSHPVTVPSNSMAGLTFTATYATGTPVTFLTVPGNLALTVDGRQNYPGYTFAWAIGSTHTVTAPATQVDGNGNTWAFQSWSNNGPATEQITVASTGNRYVATYQPAGMVSVSSNPSGVPIQLDGQTCPTPCSVGKAIGATIRVVAPASANRGEGTELAFRGWSDGAPASRSVTVSAQPTNLNAAYKTRYQLRVASDPANGLVWKTTPSSADSYFDLNTRVEVSAATKPGFEFLNWAGGASGSYPSALVVMNAPQTLVAKLNPVPYITPGGIQNSASPSGNAVAPGSAVSVYGVNLASDTFNSPASRLAQTLDNVTVRADGQMAPLFFVSPGQINVQLPSNLSAGEHALTVQVEGKPEATAGFSVARNAPGLFGTVGNAQTFAVATHQDGTAISASSPARRGEVVSLFATGLGPYNPVPADGVVVSSGTKYPLADAANIWVGEERVEPAWAGAAAGKIGVAVVQLKIDDTIPHATTVAIHIQVNNVDSNHVLLPVE